MFKKNRNTAKANNPKKATKPLKVKTNVKAGGFSWNE